MSTQRWLSRASTFVSVCAVSAAFAACGGSSKPSSGAWDVASQGGAGDSATGVAFEGAITSAPIAVRATLLMPAALENAEWPTAAPSRSIADQRKRFKSAKAASRFAEGEALAAVLWRSVAADHPDAKMMREEARSLLRGLAEEQRPTETILLDLAVAERVLGAPDKSGALYDSLILRFPQSPRHWHYRAVRAWLALRAGDLATAGEVIDGADLGAQATPATVHYVAGWLSFRRGDYAEGLARIVTAAQRWDDIRSWDTLRGEVYAVAGFAKAAPDYMIRVVDELIAGPPKREKGTAEVRERTIVKGGTRTVVTANQVAFYDRHWDLMVLGRAYVAAGEGEAATAFFTAAMEGSEIVQTGSHLAMARQSDAARNPAAAADNLLGAWTAIQNAEVSSDSGEASLSRDGVAVALMAAATRYDGLARAGAGDPYKAAALKLYGAYAAIPGRADAAAATTKASELEGAAQDDVLTAETVATLAGINAPTLSSCYARWLQRDPALAGTVTAVVTVNDAGKAELASIDPAADEAGWPAVAGCVAKQITSLPWPSPPAGQNYTLTIPHQFAAN